MRDNQQVAACCGFRARTKAFTRKEVVALLATPGSKAGHPIYGRVNPGGLVFTSPKWRKPLDVKNINEDTIKTRNGSIKVLLSMEK